MHRLLNSVKCAIVSIAMVLCVSIQLQSQLPACAHDYKQAPTEDALLVEGEPGFKKPDKEIEEVKIEKPKISEHVELYFSTMFNLLIAGGIVLVIIGIYSATKNKKA